MKTISKSLKTLGLLSLTVVTAIAVTLPAFAVENTTPGTESGVATCARITALSSSGRSSVSEKRSTLQTDFSKRLTNISTKQTGIDTKISDGRENASTKFNEKIASLEAQTGLTGAQKDAIATFKAGVAEAITVRKTSVDDARSAYRTALASQISTQQQALSSAVTTYQAAVTSAFTTAVANCTADNVVTTFASLKAGLKTARETLTAARTPDASKDAIKALIETRNTAIKAANQTFKTTVKALAATLKSALQVTPEPDSTEPTQP